MIDKFRKPSPRPKPIPKVASVYKALFLFFVTFALFSSLIVRFFQIQIIEGEKWSKQAKLQHQLLVKLPAKRGVFYGDNRLKKGHFNEDVKLVTDVIKYHLFLDPMAIQSGFKEEISQKLAGFLEKEPPYFLDELGKRLRSRRVGRWLSTEKKDEIFSWWKTFSRENRIAFNALYFLPDYKRSYPFGKLLGQVLHTVSENKDPKTQSALPTGGLELIYDSCLRGKEGKSLLLRSPRHPLDTGLVLEEAQDGADIYLTINPYLQAIAEEEIGKTVQSVKAKSGFVVMMDPNDGAILALAQYPYFYPEKFRSYFNDPTLIEETKVKAITDCYEPGSIMKAITLAIMLIGNDELEKEGKEPLFDPEKRYRCDRHFFPGRKKAVMDVREHRYLNMNMAVQKSSNVYLAYLMEAAMKKMGPDWYREKLVNVFGFGQKTGIELPSESSGFVPRPGKSYASGHLEWSAPTPYSLMMGYNILTTSLQMAKAFSIIANGGKSVEPHLVRKIVKQGQESFNERVGSKRVLSEEVARRVKESLKYVTKPGGGGFRADVYGYSEVGKTGTAEKVSHGTYSKRAHSASFAGFTPSEKPAFVIVIGIDEPQYRYIPGLGMSHYGGKCAAPCFKKIASRALNYLGIAPDDPHGYPKGDPRFNEEKADWMKEAKELGKLYKEWNG
ncbi:MAG: penicillin-binding protein 2 [Simkaniaceae bacterium]